MKTQVGYYCTECATSRTFQSLPKLHKKFFNHPGWVYRSFFGLYDEILAEGDKPDWKVDKTQH